MTTKKQNKKTRKGKQNHIKKELRGPKKPLKSRVMASALPVYFGGTSFSEDEINKILNG